MELIAGMLVILALNKILKVASATFFERKKIMVKVLNDEEKERLKGIDVEDKILNGDWYQFSSEPKLKKTVRESYQKIFEINQLSISEYNGAQVALQNFLPHLESQSEIYFPIKSIEYPEQLFIGEHTFINDGLQALSAGKVMIGSHCFIGPNCQFYTPNHHVTDASLRREGWQYDLPIRIGGDCWLGGGVILLPGITLGDDVVVGAGSVVVKDFPSHTVIAGNPAHILHQKKESNVYN